eukprot:6173499-Pleurochrysis_carterae.AAC.1
MCLRIVGLHRSRALFSVLVRLRSKPLGFHRPRHMELTSSSHMGLESSSRGTGKVKASDMEDDLRNATDAVASK